MARAEDGDPEEPPKERHCVFAFSVTLKLAELALVLVGLMFNRLVNNSIIATGIRGNLSWGVGLVTAWLILVRVFRVGNRVADGLDWMSGLLVRWNHDV